MRSARLRGVALGLTVQRLVLTELLEHDHCKQAWACPAACNDMERCRRLTDLFAVPAAELLPHRLDDLPLAWLRFQRARYILAKFT